MAVLIPLHQAVARQIGTWFPAAACAAASGRMTEDEIARAAIKPPAIRVVCLGLPKAEAAGDGEVDREVTFAADILTAEPVGLPDDGSALAIVEALLLRLPGQRWGEANVHPVAESAATAENLCSATLAAAGLALWAVVWTQRVRVGDNSYPNGPVLSAEPPQGGEGAR